MKTSTIQNNILKFVSIIFWIIIWQTAYVITNKEILLVSPFSVLKRLSQLIVTLDFWIITTSSILSITAGILIGILIGTILGILTYISSIAYHLFYPAIAVIRATPVASFIILTLVWLRTDTVPTFIVFLMVLPVIWGNVHQGLNNTDVKLLEMAQIFRINHIKTIRYIYIPSVFPYFLAALNTSIGLGWKAGIAAQVISNVRSSIGGQLYESKIYIETLDVFTWTVVIIIISMLFEYLFKKSIGRFSH